MFPESFKPRNKNLKSDAVLEDKIKVTDEKFSKHITTDVKPRGQLPADPGARSIETTLKSPSDYN
jgi:hypothetical protein